MEGRRLPHLGGADSSSLALARAAYSRDPGRFGILGTHRQGNELLKSDYPPVRVKLYDSVLLSAATCWSMVATCSTISSRTFRALSWIFCPLFVMVEAQLVISSSCLSRCSSALTAWSISAATACASSQRPPLARILVV